LISSFFIIILSQKAIKEKEFELVASKNQKLENLCRALQEERRSLSEKLQGAGSQAHTDSAGPTEKEGPEELETPGVPKDEDHIQETAAPAPADPPTPPKTPLTKELAKLKAEQSRLEEIAGSFRISHVIPAETVVSQSRGASEEPEENRAEEPNGEQIQEVEEDARQEQRDLEMESVD